MQYLKELTNLNGVSGNEENVREFIKKKIEKYVTTVEVDKVGNLIAYKKGKKFFKENNVIRTHG